MKGWQVILAAAAAAVALTGGAAQATAQSYERAKGPKTRVLESLVVRSGRTRVIAADRLVVKEELIVKAGATLESTKDVLTIIAPRKLVLAGTIRAAGDVVMVSHRALLPTRAELEGLVEPRTGLVSGRTRASSATARWVIRGAILPGEPVGEAEVSPQSLFTVGGNGRRGPTRWLQVFGNLTLGTQNGPPQQLQARDGEDGKDWPDNCNKTAGNGGQGGNLVINASAVLRLHNVSISGGNGGHGGDAFGLACAGGTNTGGAGGMPGMFSLTAGGYLGRGTFRVDGTVSINGFNAGHGGDASIVGLPNKPTGFSVAAVGGAGGEVKEKDRPGRPGRGFVLDFSNIRYGSGGSWLVSIGRGGHGGDAFARGGPGMANLDNIDCDPNTGEPVPPVAGHGGEGTATGGKGGDVNVTFNGGPQIALGPFSFLPGRGGDADANGGWGGNGQFCHWGGRGGNGGNATGTAGAGGASTLMPPLGPGARSTTGGGGGNGGNGALGGGRGGNGGNVNGPTGGGNGGPGDNAFVPPFAFGGRGGDAGCAGGAPGPGGTGPAGSLGPGSPCP